MLKTRYPMLFTTISVYKYVVYARNTTLKKIIINKTNAVGTYLFDHSPLKSL